MVKQMSLLKSRHVQAGEIPAMNRWPGLAYSTCTVLTWTSEQLYNWSKPHLRTSAIRNSPPALSCYCQTYLIAVLHREGRQQQHSQACSKCIQLGSPHSSNHFHGNGTVGSSHSLSLLWLNWCTCHHGQSLWIEICGKWLVQTNNQSCQCGACSGLFRLVQACLNYIAWWYNSQFCIAHTYVYACLFGPTTHHILFSTAMQFSIATQLVFV